MPTVHADEGVGNYSQIGSPFPIINEKLNSSDVLVQNPYKKEAYWVPQGAAAEAARQAALGSTQDTTLSPDEINRMTPIELGLFWAKGGGERK